MIACGLFQIHLFLILGLNARETWSAAAVRDCPHKGAWLPSPQKCLMVVVTEKSEFLSVYDARHKCWSIGGEIASVDHDSAGTAVALLKNVHQSTLSRSAYIGLNDVDVEGNWTWFDGEDFDQRMKSNWDAGEPNSGGGGNRPAEDCVVAKARDHHVHGPTLQLHDYPCCLASGIRAVLCQMNDTQLTTPVHKRKQRFPEDNDSMAIECIGGVNECLEKGAMCYNGGTCVDKLGRYECLCPNGFTGRQCESDIDECLEAGCLNNSTCRDLIDSYQCVCQTGFVGQFCETAICPKPPDVENSTREGGNVTDGSIVRYTCNFGHRFPDQFQFPGQSSGQPSVDLICSGHDWTIANQSDGSNFSQSHDLPSCQPVFCSIVPTWIGVEALDESDMSHGVGDVVTYRCSDGKQFTEETSKDDEEDGDGVKVKVNVTTVCQSDGSWNPSFKKCQYVDTGKKDKIEPVEAPGAAAIGTIAIIFISIEMSLIVLMDIDHLIRHAKMFKDNIVVGFNRFVN